ncbi:TonB-dependent receptor [Gloeobacter violaceus]|uniref:TonB-dependent receptor n=1 Tax=Gloeobacter violaceus TaxID=33072 RepID=UPI000312715F|nr:TonB-dependent receptor [Gloeobacter violaceus]
MRGIVLVPLAVWLLTWPAGAERVQDFRPQAAPGAKDLLAQEVPGAPRPLEGFADTRLNQPLYAPFRREGTLKEASRPAYVITRRQIEAQGARTVQEALRYLPGILSDGTAGTQLGTLSSQFIRGSNSSQVLVLLDGRPLNDLGFFGGYDLSELTTDTVERVEVVPGGGSTLYGSDAVGGVINIVSRAPSERPSTTLKASAGSFALNEQSLQTSGRSGAVGWRVDYNRLQANNNFPFEIASVGYAGTRENADVTYNNFSARLEADLSERTALSASVLSQNKDLGVPGGVPIPIPGSVGQFNTLTTDTRQFTNNWLADLGLRAKLGLGEDSLLTARLFADFLNYRYDAPLSQGSRDEIRRRSWGAQVQHTWRVSPEHHLTYGLDYRTVSAFNSTYLYPLAATNINYDGQVGQGALFVRDEIALGEDLKLNLGLRQDISGLAKGSFTSPSAGVRWQVGEDMALRANYARSFRAPLLSDLYFKLRGFFTVDGNPDLRPEQGDSYDIGIDQKIGEAALVRLTYFANTVADTIAFTFTGPTSGSYANLGLVRSTGIEASIEVRLAPSWYLSVNFTGTEPRILADANPAYVGKELSFRGADSFNASLAYESTGGWFAGLFVHSVGRFFTDNANTEALGGYTTTDLKLRLPLTDNLNFNAQVNNLFNQQYQVYPGYPGVGINFRTGLSWTI